MDAIMEVASSIDGTRLDALIAGWESEFNRLERLFYRADQGEHGGIHMMQQQITATLAILRMLAAALQQSRAKGA